MPFDGAFFDPLYFDTGLAEQPPLMPPGLDLLPDIETPLDRELALLSSTLDDIDPTLIETIWDAWRCPAPLLPWLAWALSVDVWDDAWAEPVKRQAIADSPLYHRIKGTVRAVRSALALAQRPFEITEWFETIPRRRRGTARVFIETTLDDIPRILRTIRPLVLAAKPKSRAVAFGAGELAEGTIAIGGGLLVDSLTTVEPYSYAGEDASGDVAIGGGILVDTLITIEAIS